MSTQYQYSNCVGSVRFSFFPCTSCRETNIVEFAMCYCETCQQCFCRECSRLHDQLFSKHMKYSQGEMKNWPVSKDLEDFLQLCEKHTNESVSVFCKDHSQLCCYECISVSHSECKTLKLNSAKKHTADVHELLIRHRINLVKLKNHQSCCESRVHELTISYQEYEHMVREINININSTLDIIERRTLKKTPIVERNILKKMHQSIHFTLDEIETSTLNEARQTLVSLRSDLNTGVDTYIKHYPELKLLQEALQYSSDKENKKLCFIATRKSMEKLLEVESYLNQNFVKLEHSVFKQSMRDTENYFSKLSGLWAWVQSREAVTYNSNSDFAQYVFRLSKLGRNEINVAGKYQHNAVDDKQLKTMGRTKNKYEVLVKENAKLRGDLTAALSREMHEKSREYILEASKINERLLAHELDEVIQHKDAAHKKSRKDLLQILEQSKRNERLLAHELDKVMQQKGAAHEKSREDIIEASKSNERLLAHELDEVIQQKVAAEEELLTLKHNLKKCFTSEDKTRLQEQIARKQDCIVHLQDQNRVMKKRLCTLQEIVWILERRSTSTDESNNRSETEILGKLIEEDVELKVESSLIKERLATDERVYYSTIGTMTLQSKVDASEEKNNWLNKTVTSLQEQIQTQEREVAQLQTRMTQKEEAFRQRNKQHDRTLQARREFEMLVHQLQAEADRQKEEYERLVGEARHANETSLAQLAAKYEQYVADILRQHAEEKAKGQAGYELLSIAHTKALINESQL